MQRVHTEIDQHLEDFGGIRIEDTAVITGNGCEVLTPTSKELRLL